MPFIHTANSIQACKVAYAAIVYMYIYAISNMQIRWDYPFTVKTADYIFDVNYFKWKK